MARLTGSVAADGGVGCASRPLRVLIAGVVTVGDAVTFLEVVHTGTVATLAVKKSTGTGLKSKTRINKYRERERDPYYTRIKV